MATQDNESKVDNVRSLLHTQRQRLYPTLYSDNSDLQQILDHFAVDYYLNSDETCGTGRKDSGDRNDCCGVEPAFKKSKYHHPYAAAVVETVANSNTGIIGTNKFIDDNISTEEVPRATKLKVGSNTNSNEPEQMSDQAKEDIIVPSEAPSSSRTSIDETIHQESQQQQKQTAQLPSSTVCDIWGQIPPKEYIPNATCNNNNTIITNSGNESVATCMMICSVCQQKVGSSLRYASHLDKCLGIGTMSRNANSNTSSISQIS